MSLLPSRFAIPLILLTASLQSGLASPGAAVPWITYYSGEMSTNGTRMGPGYQPFTVEAESAERSCIKLSETGQYVELKAREWANSLVVRYSIPDTATGGGFDSTISVYKNGVFVQKLAVTSKYSWLYGFIRGPTIRPTVILGIFIMKPSCWASMSPQTTRYVSRRMPAMRRLTISLPWSI